MSTFIEKLWDDLNLLVSTNEAFYKQEFKLDDSIYWIYNYRLATWSDFQLPSAKWCCGTMFEVDGVGNMVRLASLPMSKFFNANENPDTMNLDLDDVVSIEVKSDGSLMSTYIHDGELRLKSKGSLFSEQAIDAMNWLAKDENLDLRRMLAATTSYGITVNLEWVAPWNRIVLHYEQPRLIVLNTIFMQSGHYLGISNNHVFGEYMAPEVDLKGLSHKEFIEQVPSMTNDIEGFIFVMSDGQRVKIKTDKYISLHHTKDSITNPRRLFECVLDEACDDLRSMFSTDAVAIKLINDMEQKVSAIYNHMITTVESLHVEHKDLDRKSFALKMKDIIDPMYFGLVMNLYCGKTTDYKEFMKKRYKEFGFNDIQKEAV